MSCCSFSNCSLLRDLQSNYSSLQYNYSVCEHAWINNLKVADDLAAEEKKFNEPLLWIGIYVAAASLICTLAMAADVIRGFHLRKLWFPCKFFTLNATSLTLVAVSMKLPVDLTTAMPRTKEQFAKLSSMIFMCTVMGNFMPSLGPMRRNELLMNVMALGIMVITLIVNVCIQLKTGVICFFQIEHVIVMVLLLLLLVVLCFSALTVPVYKKILEVQYEDKHRMVSNEESQQTEKFTVEKMKEIVNKYWVMAESGDPQFVMASFATGSASGAISCLAALTLAEAELTYLRGRVESNHSDYQGSTILIFWIQCIGVVVGTIAPAFRWLTAISFKFSKKGSHNYRNIFKVEHYWTQCLVEWKQRPIASRIVTPKCRKLIQDTKDLILKICIRIQLVIVVACKTISFIPIFFISVALSYCSCCKLLKEKFMPEPRPLRDHEGSESEASKELELSRYVLKLEVEDELPKQMLKNISSCVNQFIQRATKQQPKNLMKLLEKSTGFKGVSEFDNDQVPRLLSDEPPNCWSLTVATLTSIAISLPNVKNDSVDQLLCSVSEGIFYIRIIEKALDKKGDLVNIINAADVVWLGVELYRTWLDKNLQKMSLRGNPPEENLEMLGEIAKKSVIEFKSNMDGGADGNPARWPINVIAANSMYRISQTTLMGYRGSCNDASEKLFEQLSVMIADILSACLTNLPHVITAKCYCSDIEKRKVSVQEAARLVGEGEIFLKTFQHEIPSMGPDQAAYIDEWRAITRPRTPPTSVSSSNNNFCELHIAVE